MRHPTAVNELTLVKLGGSLITDKTRSLTPRTETLARLAEEIAGAGSEPPLVVGHGSGSFGHVTAAKYGVHRGVDSPEAVDGVAATQVHAHRLHRLVVEALWKAGCRPFSLAPSAAMMAAAGRPGSWDAAPLRAALRLGLLPVTFGDVVMDTEWGASICSTEEVFEALIAALAGSGQRVARVLWMGATAGILDGDGSTIPAIDGDNVAEVAKHLGETVGADVTGGMRLRLETAWRLAERGIESWILNGLEPGVLRAALDGEPAGGTRVAPSGGA